MLREPAGGGRLCLPDSRGAGAGRMPPLLGRPEGQNEMVVDLKDVDLKDVDLKDIYLKDIDLKSPPARQNEMAAAICPKRCPTAIPNSLVLSRLNDYYSQKKSLFVLFDAVAMESVN